MGQSRHKRLLCNCIFGLNQCITYTVQAVDRHHPQNPKKDHIKNYEEYF